LFFGFNGFNGLMVFKGFHIETGVKKMVFKLLVYLLFKNQKPPKVEFLVFMFF